MSPWITKRRIAHPDWIPIASASVKDALDLHASGRIPDSMQIPVIVIPVKHLLRGVYGSNLMAAWVLLTQAVGESLGRISGTLWGWWSYRVLMKSPDRDLNEILALSGEEEEE